jgi:hypothetical protein
MGSVPLNETSYHWTTTHSHRPCIMGRFVFSMGQILVVLTFTVVGRALVYRPMNPTWPHKLQFHSFLFPCFLPFTNVVNHTDIRPSFHITSRLFLCVSSEHFHRIQRSGLDGNIFTKTLLLFQFHHFTLNTPKDICSE